MDQHLNNQLLQANLRAQSFPSQTKDLDQIEGRYQDWLEMDEVKIVLASDSDLKVLF